MYRTLVVIVVAATLAGCGGTASSPPTANVPTAGPTHPTPPAPAPTPPPPPTSTPAGPTVVQVTAGQTAAGIDFAVPAPTGTNPNAQNLGVAALTGAASAYNTGDVIHRGATQRVVLFGPGLSSGMTVTVLGPNDIQISNVAGTTATDNTPGVTFTAAVAADAALGARTVVLKDSSGNMTAFAGGLEVLP